jgi:hypothetical protein
MELMYRTAIYDALVSRDEQPAAVDPARVKRAVELSAEQPEWAVGVFEEILQRSPEVRFGGSLPLADAARLLLLETLIRRRDPRRARPHAVVLSQHLDLTIPTRELMACGKVILQTADLLGCKDAHEESLVLSEAVWNTFAGAEDQKIRVMGIRALINTVRPLGRLGRFAEASQALEQVASLGEPALLAVEQMAEAYGNDRLDVPDQEAVALALRVVILEDLGREQEMRQGLADLDDGYASKSQPMIRWLLEQLHQHIPHDQSPHAE